MNRALIVFIGSFDLSTNHNKYKKFITLYNTL